MKRVLTAVVLIPVVLLLVFRAPLWLFALAVAAIIVLALHEYLNIAEAAGIKPFKWLTYVVSMFLVFLGWWLRGSNPHKFNVFLFALSWAWIPLYVFLPLIFGIPLTFRKELRMGLSAVATSGFGTVYIALSLSLLISLRADPVQSVLVLFVLLSVWVGDIAAYYVGRSFGRHKLAPIVSPNKSWEGALASVLASVAMAILFFHYQEGIRRLFVEAGPMKLYWLFPVPGQLPSLLLQVSWGHAVVLGILTNVAAQFGDLFESALKRGAGVKDSGTLLPGHGGILDRIDALLFAIPVVWYYAQITGFLLP
jgi:phosphatidate cytidylyltransferase